MPEANIFGGKASPEIQQTIKFYDSDESSRDTMFRKRVNVSVGASELSPSPHVQRLQCTCVDWVVLVPGVGRQHSYTTLLCITAIRQTCFIRLDRVCLSLASIVC